MSTFGEVLKEFKDAEEAENLVAILDDKDLQLGMMAWKNTKITYHTSQNCQSKDPIDRWEWLWSRIEFNEGDVGRVAGIKGQNASHLIYRLKGLRLIYPDGTISRFASQYLNALIMAKLKQVTPRSPGRPPIQKD